MNEKIISQICLACLAEEPHAIERCTVGQGNYVYIVECTREKYVVRCSKEQNAYNETVYWLRQLEALQIPVPKVMGVGKMEGYEYLILSYFEGQDIGLVYEQLTEEDKQAIAKEIVQIQEKVATLKLENVPTDWSWNDFIKEMLDRAAERIVQNGYFEVEKVERLAEQAGQLDEYFAQVKPIAYLDDVSTKNLLIHKGRISGIIDIDWMGIGDKLTYVAMTNMALLNMECDTTYVQYILEEMQVTAEQRRAFLFYTLMFCVDFMGERGMQFMDKKVEVNQQIISRMNGIYDMLWKEWSEGERA